jgi:hypothetical protein
MVFLVQIGPGAWSVCAQTPEEQAAAQAKQLMEQAVIFRLEHLGEAAASLAALAGASYVEEAFLTDPWGQPFEYAASGGPQRELAIWSRGPGGTGGFAPGNPGQFTGEAVGYSTASGRYVQGR